MVRGGLSAYGYGCTNGVEKRVDSGQTGDFSNGRSKFMRSIWEEVPHGIKRTRAIRGKKKKWYPLTYLCKYWKSKITHTYTYIPCSIFTRRSVCASHSFPAQAHHMYTYIMSITQKEIVKNSIRHRYPLLFVLSSFCMPSFPKFLVWSSEQRMSPSDSLDHVSFTG